MLGLAFLAGRAALSVLALEKADALAEDGFLLRDFITAVEEGGRGGGGEIHVRRFRIQSGERRQSITASTYAVSPST